MAGDGVQDKKSRLDQSSQAQALLPDPVSSTAEPPKPASPPAQSPPPTTSSIGQQQAAAEATELDDLDDKHSDDECKKQTSSQQKAVGKELKYAKMKAATKAKREATPSQTKINKPGPNFVVEASFNEDEKEDTTLSITILTMTKTSGEIRRMSMDVQLQRRILYGRT